MDRDQLVVLISQLVSGGATLEGALRNLGMLGPEKSELLAAVAEYETRVKRIRSFQVPKALENDDLGDAWYIGPKDGDVFWPAVQESLAKAGLSRTAIDSVDNASTKIVSYLSPPGRPSIDDRGLVLGYVQSGKTTSFMSVIAKAADAGYRLFVVLSGIHNSLRWQTQKRMNHQLIHPVESRWFKLTDESDFQRQPNVNFLLGDTDTRLLAVVKKNPSRLRALNRWLNGAAPETLHGCPILVIDDEADQASIDVGTEEQRSKINALLLELLNGPAGKPRKAAYVGYTATPFANFLIDPDFVNGDLYPKDFIVDLEKPEGHFGTEVIFGREPRTSDEDDPGAEGLDVVRLVPDEEAAELRPPSRRDERQGWTPLMTPSLEDALRWFCLATAARRARGGGVAHSTMLVHTTVLTDAQDAFGPPIRSFLDHLATGVGGEQPTVVDPLRTLWEEEQRRLPSHVCGQEPVGFDDLLQCLPDVLREVQVVIDNYRSESRLAYPDEGSGDAGRTVVAVGGNTLSRGLTLEGLVASFFVRTASAYDTLLQMGRWFGYRRGYEDLPRIWMTAQLRDWFIWLATVEHEIRLDIARYEAEGITPRQFAVRIATHPQMAVTSALKMRNAVAARVSYGGRRIQTILFHHRNADWLRTNLDAGRKLVRAALSAGVAAEDIGHGRMRLRRVPVDALGGFLSAYGFHENSKDLQRKPLTDYIASRNRVGELLEWNVVVMGSDAAGLGTVDLGLKGPVGLINRSRMELGLPYANIKSLMSKVDRVADLDNPGSDLAALPEEALQAMRPRGLGLLLLYPLSKDSKPGRPVPGRQRRAPLNAVEDVLGVGMVFPDTPDDTAQTYISAPLPNFEEEKDDPIDLDAVDPVDDEEGGA